jgi:hypothetical protein
MLEFLYRSRRRLYETTYIRISPRCISPQRSLSTQRLFKAFFLSDLSGEHLCFFFDQTGRAGDYLAACSVGTRMSKLVTNQAFDLDYETLLQYYFKLQQRAQFSPDAEEAKRAYLDKREPKWQ